MVRLRSKRNTGEDIHHSTQSLHLPLTSPVAIQPKQQQPTQTTTPTTMLNPTDFADRDPSIPTDDSLGNPPPVAEPVKESPEIPSKNPSPLADKQPEGPTLNLDNYNLENETPHAPIDSMPPTQLRDVVSSGTASHTPTVVFQGTASLSLSNQSPLSIILMGLLRARSTWMVLRILRP